MNLNLLLVIMAVVLICMVMDGYKKGMVKYPDLSDLPADYLCGAVPDREWSEQLL